MAIKVLALALLLVSSPSFAGQGDMCADAVDQVKLVAESSVRVQDGRYLMRVHVRNCSAAPVEIYEGNLPWDDADHVIVFAYYRRTKHVLATVAGVGMSGPSTRRLMPGENVSGEIPVEVFLSSEERRTFVDRVRDEGLLLFWSYEVRGPGGSRFLVADWISMPPVSK